MTAFLLHENQEFSADWIRPPDDTLRIPGSVRFTSKKIELNLHGTFEQPAGKPGPFWGDAPAAYPVIHGVTPQSKALSVLDARVFARQLYFGEMGLKTPERLIAAQMVVGAHVTVETLYGSMRFWIPGLESWLCTPTTTTTVDAQERSGTVAIKLDEAEETAVPSVDAILKWGMSVATDQSRYPSVSIDCRGFVTVIPNVAQNLGWFLEQLSALSAMLTFIAGMPMPIGSIQAKPAESAATLDILACLHQVGPPQYHGRHEFFLTRANLGENFPAVVSRWFAEATALRVPGRLAHGLLSDGPIDVYLAFLSGTQALEGFHRVKFPGLYIDDYQSIEVALGNAIPASTPADLKSALKSKIRYGNQFSLRRRLNDLNQMLGDQISRRVVSNTGIIPREWIDTRNYLTHWDAALRTEALEGQALYDACVRIQQMLRCLYLLVMGIPRETLVACLGNTSNVSQHLIQINNR